MNDDSIDGRPPGKSGPLRVVAYRSLEQLAPLAARLDALNLASRRPSPFDTFAYIEAFTAHDEFEAPGQALLLLVAWDGDEIVGFLPLREVPTRLLGLRHSELRFLLGHDNDRPRVVARPEDEARCCEAFYRHLLAPERGFALLHLNEQDSASKLGALPASLDLSHHHARRFPNNPNATIPLPYPSPDEYFQALSRNQRRQLHKDLRRLFDAGEVEVVSSRDPHARRALFELYLELEQRSWKSKIGGHIGRHPRRIAFFRRLLELGPPLETGVHLLLLSGLPIAGFVSCAFEGRLYGFEEAYDEAYRDLSPGNAMLLLVLRDAIEARYRSLNLLGNYAYYKARWLATITETEAVQLFRKGSLVHLKALVGEALRKLRPARTPWELDFNVEKRELVEHRSPEAPSPRPAPDAEQARAEATLRALTASGAPFRRYGGAALRQALLHEPIKAQRGGAAPRTAVQP